MKKILFLGDSISIHYSPFLTKYLSEHFKCYFREDSEKAKENLDVPTAANSGDSRMLLSFIKQLEKSKLLKYDIVAFNCGLHDIKRNIENNNTVISLDEYFENLSEIISILKRNKILPVWINTTAVDDNTHNSNMKWFKRYNADVITYNNAALQIMNKEKIKVINLYDFTRGYGIKAFDDHVHYKEKIRIEQAKYISSCILEM